MAVAGELWLVVGESGSGKTTFCQTLVAVVRQRGVKVRGLLSPARFEGGMKVGIEVQDLHSEEKRPLAWHRAFALHPPFSSEPVAVGEWLLDAEALEWGNRVLREAIPCDLLVVDELGPLEFLRGKGWQAAFAALDSGAYRLALITVRESLRSAVHARWRVGREIRIAGARALQAALDEELALLQRILA
ncbi:MAG: nucleoside-triphosphatase [Anaerolineales bacterium]|nr:nucleoside-triphosphatase [Anaerolineales bacterium]MDW8161636.1 nucleoside-triphosphatase [Anaerolineales bacterium]